MLLDSFEYHFRLREGSKVLHMLLDSFEYHFRLREGSKVHEEVHDQYLKGKTKATFPSLQL